MVLLFETERLLVRQLMAEDVDNLYAITGNAELMRYVDDARPLSRQLTEKWVQVSLNNYATKGYGCSAVINKRDGAFIGFCGLVRSEQAEPPDDAELIYALLKSHWGQGLATEVARAMVAYGFRACGLKRIIATIFPENVASAAVLEKLGMHFVTRDVDEDGQPTDLYEISIS